MTAVETDSERKTKLCPLYKVLCHNDNVTTFEFVIGVLVSIFGKSVEEAMALATTVHFEGVACVAVLPLEVAELKVEQTISLARTEKYPLVLTIELN